MTWLDDLVCEAHSQISEEALEYLWSRGVSDEQIEGFQIGYVSSVPASTPAAFRKWAEQKGVADALVFPLTTSLGVVKGVQFRVASREQKGYMDYFEDRSELALFGLAQAMPHLWRNRAVWVVEGVFDSLPIQRHYPAVIPTLTAHVSESFVCLLGRLVDRIWLGYDRDDTGKRASSWFLNRYGKDFDRVRVVNYPVTVGASSKSIKDPGDLWEAWGDREFGAFVRTVTEGY